MEVVVLAVVNLLPRVLHLPLLSALLEVPLKSLVRHRVSLVQRTHNPWVIVLVHDDALLSS